VLRNRIWGSTLRCYYPISRSCIDEGKFISDDQIFVFMAKGKSKSEARTIEYNTSDCGKKRILASWLFDNIPAARAIITFVMEYLGGSCGTFLTPYDTLTFTNRHRPGTPL
jgi:hypothetical protein